MPYIETPGDIADRMADWLGIYECGNKNCPYPNGDHCHECECRSCFVVGLTERIKESVKNEQQLYPEAGK